MRRLAGILLTAAIITAAGEARAEFFSGNALLEQCTKESEDFSQIFCLGYVTAIYDASLCPMNVSGWKHAAPGGVQYKQLVRVAVKFLERNPQYLHYAAPGLVAEAFQEAWPCP